MVKGKKGNQPVNFRDSENNLLIVGKKGLIDLIKHPSLSKQIKKIVIGKNQIAVQKILTANNLVFETQNKGWFNTKFAQLNHQNCVVYLTTPKLGLNLQQLIAKTKKTQKSLILVLEKINDPHNFGAILRTAAAAQVDGVVVLNKNQAPLNATVLKVSQGLALLVDLVVVNNLISAVKILKKNGFWIYGAILNNQAQKFHEIPYDPKTVLVLGNEGRGISNLLAKTTDFQIMIPMAKEINSLNVAVAGGILIYQIKQKQGGGL